MTNSCHSMDMDASAQRFFSRESQVESFLGLSGLLYSVVLPPFLQELLFFEVIWE